MPDIYVQGIGGLGNILYQVATAIYYAEEYGYTIKMQNTDRIFYGTSITHGRQTCMTDDNNNRIPYKDTIFNKLEFIDVDKKKSDGIQLKIRFENKIIIPNDKHITIKGFCQNLKLIEKYFNKIPQYLNLDEPFILDYIKNKYGDVSEGIMVGLRVGRDFKTGINRDKYIKALQIMSTFSNKVYIISDVKNAWTDVFKLDKKYPAICVDEKDIIQFYLGLQLKHYIFSESTFHAWISYIGTIKDKSKKTICFSSDFTRRKLMLSNWNII